jgi:hypothetical protein
VSSSEPRNPSVLDAETMADRVVVTSDGRKFMDVALCVTPEAMDRFYKGYKCANCLEDQENAWPKECPLCGFPIASEQMDYLASRRVGNEQIGSKLKLSDEFARMREIREYEDRTGIRLPDEVRFPPSGR